jgi:hypothetical protein
VRAVLGVLGLLVVLAVVMFSAKNQMQAIAPAPDSGAAPAQQVDAAKQALQRALEQGAARASDALP